MLGFLDADDPTNVPLGLAAVCRNSMFDLTSVRTRDGFQTTMTGLYKSPVTGLLGLVFNPETPSQNFFQLPIMAQLIGSLQYESPLGSGNMVAFPGGLFARPANSHFIGVQPYNKGWMAWSDLSVPLSGMCCVDPVTLNVDPYGMKPFGWTWLPNTSVLLGEVATPTTPGGNLHTYRCIQAGTTGVAEPAWPLVENGTVADGTATWEEYTAVLANRLPNPASPVLNRIPSGGTFAAGRDVYVVITVINGMGESLASVAAVLSNTNSDDAVQVILPAISAFAGWIRGLGAPYAITGYQVYEADVAHAEAAPPATSYQQVGGGPFPLNSSVEFSSSATSGIPPPSICSARITPGQLPTPDVGPTVQRLSNTGTGVGASATVTESGGAVQNDFDITAGGTLYQNPIVTITDDGPGVGATATATQSGGVVNSITLTAGGANYANPIVTITDSGESGNFPAGRDVYVLQTYLNSAGETPAGPANVITDTELDDAVAVGPIAAPADYPQITQINIYECDVPTGSPSPPSTEFALWGTFVPGATTSITASAAGPPPPIVNLTGPGGNIQADQPTGGINGGQGYRYASICFMNRNYSISGFTQASVIQYDVDEDGWELAIFNVTPGPGNIIARTVNFAVADGAQAGPFYWIGTYDPQAPSQNFIYPQVFTSDSIPITATIFADNTTTSGTFNFTDEYLDDENDVTDRLKIIWPAQCVHIAYHASIDRMIQTGLYGNWSGCNISLADAPEDYYADTGPVQIESDDGSRAWGSIEYRQVSYLMKERSGYSITANPNNPQGWIARRRWDKAGPCGPRAFDACDKFMMWVHRSGVYRYVDDEDLVSKEIPYWWQRINWAAATTICLKIDYETHQVQVLLPIDGSTVPNQKLMLNFEEGWANPIHFSTYSGREISMDACRKYSADDMSAFLCTRIERQLPAPPDPVYGGDASIPLTPSSFYVSQFIYGSSGPDGTVQASQRGTFDDNGEGIDWQYETVCPQQAMAVSKCEGFVLNARGAGKLFAWMLGMRASKYGQQQGAPAKPPVIPVRRPIDLDIEQGEGITRAVPTVLSEKWRMRFTNGKVPGAWCSIKWLGIYTIPMYSGREESEKGG